MSICVCGHILICMNVHRSTENNRSKVKPTGLEYDLGQDTYLSVPSVAHL